MKEKVRYICSPTIEIFPDESKEEQDERMKRAIKYRNGWEKRECSRWAIMQTIKVTLIILFVTFIIFVIISTIFFPTL